MWRLERALVEIAGLPHVSLQPSAGSHGELAGLLLTRAYHEDRGETRTKVLTPDTAHGTNPATVTMAGYEAVKVGTAPDGGVDVDDLRAKAGADTACLMLTNPNTLGLFDRNIEEIARIVHEAGATLYYDGANLNAVVGISRPGDMGFDIVHFNLHKTFTQPHGGGGPGAGPIAVSDRIEPYLPVPRVVESASRNGAEPAYELDQDHPKSIGRLRGFQGNFGVFVRSYGYIRSVGGDGLRDVAETAVLNANYLRTRLAEPGIGELLPVAFDRTCMHEFVLSGAPAKRELGIKTLDIAKRLLDHRVHPPTVYFPLLVHEALMIEPTETETRETLDRFADSIRAILEEGRRDPELVKGAPYETPVRRLDEGRAARRPTATSTGCTSSRRSPRGSASWCRPGCSCTRCSRPRTSSPTGPTRSPSARTSASTSSSCATSRSASTSASGRRSWSRATASPTLAGGSWTSSRPTPRCPPPSVASRGPSTSATRTRRWPRRSCARSPIPAATWCARRTSP